MSDLRDMLNDALGGGKFTTEEKAALKSYTGSGYLDLNKATKTLRTGIGDPDTKILAGLDSAFARASLQDDLLVYRGIDDIAWGSFFGDAKVGDLVTDHGYVSTTINPKLGWSTHQIEIRLNKGASAIPVAPLSLHQTELEIVLARNAQFRIIEITDTKAVLEYIGSVQ
jgi:hypothetical protein